MYFNKLPQHLQVQIEKLTRDDEFQHRFGTDKQLDQIENMKLDKAALSRQFEYLINGYETVSDKKLHPLTLSKVTFLWLKNSPFLELNLDVNTIKQEDVDLFFYVLNTNIRKIDFQFSKAQSLNFFSINFPELTFEDGIALALHITHLMFTPLKYFSYEQKRTEGNVTVDYSIRWLTGMAIAVRQVTGYDIDFIIQELPLNIICYYYVQFRRKNGQQINDRSDEEILIMIDQRCVNIILDYWIEKRNY